MIKKFDKLILKSFLGPFAATFFIAFFILLMQSLWKYIDDLVGKGLDMLTVLQFIWYSGATLSALAMPTAILISSIMTFGNLGESSEIVAVKASGVSLLRLMRPLIFFTFGLSVITFFFANNVIPYSTFKFYSIYREILVKKPAFDLQEGVFYNKIPGYSIRVAEKAKDGANIKNVLIYEGGNTLQDNTIAAKAGIMEIAPDKSALSFNLFNGTRYQERGAYGDSSTEFVRLKFREFRKLFDLGILQQGAGEDSTLKNNIKMFSARQLEKHLDSLTAERNVMRKTFAGQLKLAARYNDTPASIKPALLRKMQAAAIPENFRLPVAERALAQLSNMKNTMYMNVADLKSRDSTLEHTKIEWHRKYAFSCICMVLFFIGAPLGSIIRKGGLGMPLVVATLFFLFYHLLNMFGERLARNDFMPAWAGMWLASMVLTPIGIFFTYKAMHDSQLFNKERYLKLFRKKQKLIPAEGAEKTLSI